MDEFLNFLTFIFEVSSSLIFQLQEIHETRSEIKAAAAQVTLALPVKGSLMSCGTCVLCITVS